MEFLAPSMACLLHVKRRLECGCSTAEALRSVVGQGRDEFAGQLRRWWLARERGVTLRPRDLFPSPLQRVLVEVFERGLKGEPILARLAEIEEEMSWAMADCVDRHIQRLPILLLLPLAGLVFPSFMLLLIGPLLSELTRSLS